MANPKIPAQSIFVYCMLSPVEAALTGAAELFFISTAALQKPE
jgi:hypothetical protein